MNGYYDLDGTQITEHDWLTKTDEYRRVALDRVGDYRVSTVWVGIDTRTTATPGRCVGPAGPVIFETSVLDSRNGWFGAEHWYYTTLKDAQAGHRDSVARMTARVVTARLHRSGGLPVTTVTDPWAAEQTEAAAS